MKHSFVFLKDCQKCTKQTLHARVETRLEGLKAVSDYRCGDCLTFTTRTKTIHEHNEESFPETKPASVSF